VCLGLQGIDRIVSFGAARPLGRRERRGVRIAVDIIGSAVVRTTRLIGSLGLCSGHCGPRVSFASSTAVGACPVEVAIRMTAKIFLLELGGTAGVLGQRLRCAMEEGIVPGGM
jgi:hypothetical protein